MRSDCPINYALENIGDKWTLLVIRDLVFEGKKFYKEFLTSKEGIATNILSDRLKKLEELDIVTSEIFEKKRTQKVYSLTEKGMDLVPMLVEMIRWSAKYETGLAVTDEFIKQVNEDREHIITAIRENVGTTTFSANQ